MSDGQSPSSGCFRDVVANGSFVTIIYRTISLAISLKKARFDGQDAPFATETMFSDFLYF